MSYEQFVRYKQQLRSITETFLKVANTLTTDQLEIVIAKLADRVLPNPNGLFEDRYKGRLLADLLELREEEELKQGKATEEKLVALRKNYLRENHNIQQTLKEHQSEVRIARKEHERQLCAFREQHDIVSWRWLLARPYRQVVSLGEPAITEQRLAEYLIEKIANFRIVTEGKQPADKTPEECTPTREEIKRLTYQGE